jgi:hypothetical protein
MTDSQDIPDFSGDDFADDKGWSGLADMELDMILTKIANHF